QSCCQAVDCYVGVALSPSNFGHARRCPADRTAGIVGLWADIDIADPTAHKGMAYPLTQEDACTLLASAALQPSLVVHSGHGLQAWWLFDKPWLFATSDDRKQAARLAKHWQGHLRRLASVSGWTIDSTADLARVLRVPGTR